MGQLSTTYVLFSPVIKVIIVVVNTPGRRQSKTLMLSTNVDQNSKKQGFRMPFVARLATNDYRKHCFPSIFDPRSSIILIYLSVCLQSESDIYGKLCKILTDILVNQNKHKLIRQ